MSLREHETIPYDLPASMQIGVKPLHDCRRKNNGNTGRQPPESSSAAHLASFRMVAVDLEQKLLFE